MGPPFERTFKPNFMAGLRKRWDDYSSLYRHLHGQDPGGMPPSTAAQLAVNPNHLNATIAHPGGNAAARQKSATRFEARNDEAIDLMRVHIPVTRIQNAIDEMVQWFETNDPKAPVLAAQVAGGVVSYAAGHPNAGNPMTAADLQALQKHGNSLARHIWAKIESLGIRAASGLESLSKAAAWTAMSLEPIWLAVIERSLRSRATVRFLVAHDDAGRPFVEHLSTEVLCPV